jgi:aminoglycoside phosphotransferase (APT) family kinase protein
LRGYKYLPGTGPTRGAVVRRQNDAMDAADAIDALERLTGEPPRSVRPIPGGWASFTFEVDGRYIARFPRNAEIARCTEAELDLLPRLGPLVDFAVPEVRWQGTRQGFPFFVYESIPGRPLDADAFDAHPGLAGELGAALRQLHGLGPATDGGIAGPAGGAGGADGADPAGPAGAVPPAHPVDPVEAWRSGYAALRRSSDQQVAPRLDAGTASSLEWAWDHFEAGLVFGPAFVHADLGLEHVLVRDGHLAGVIDWETASIGDPAIDFVGFHIGLGPERTGRILDAYGQPGATLRPRVLHYVWIGAVHAVLYGLEADRPEIVEEALRGLAERLRAVG